MDAPVLDLDGPVSDLRAHLVHHGAFFVCLAGTYDDLGFFTDSGDLIRELSLYHTQVADPSALASLVTLERLHHPPAVAQSQLRHLPELRSLWLRDEADLALLDGCTALRELYLSGKAGSPLTSLPPSNRLELLSVGYRSRDRLVGVHRLESLRTLLFPADSAIDAPILEFLERRFRVTADDIATLAQHPPADDQYWRPRGFIRLDADRRRALAQSTSLSTSDSAEPYSVEVTAQRPACVVILIDRSASTAHPFGFDFRVIADASAPEHDITTRHGHGPDGEQLIGEGIADAVNAYLRRLADRCIAEGAVRHDVHVALIEYGARVGSAWSGALAGRSLVPIAEIAEHPLDDRDGAPRWIEAVMQGDTPLGEAMEQATAIVEAWARDYRDSYPPVVINLSAGSATGDDLARHGWGLRSVRTRHGGTLLFSVVREGSYGAPYFAIEGNSQAEREPEFRLASPLPVSIEEAVRAAGYILVGRPRGCVWYAAAADFENLLHLLTALPGLPWPDDLVRHPLPPFDPPEWARVQIVTTAGTRDRANRAAWRVPTIRGPMTEALFWRLIETSRRGATDVRQQGERVGRMLEQLPEEDLFAFDRLLSARRQEAYRWDLWAVAFIAMGGCSDDGFEYFRNWLVAQGRSYFEAALADPARAAKRIAPGDEALFEGLLYVAGDAYERSKGKEDWYERIDQRTQGLPEGEEWEEEDLPRLYPKLVKKYGR